MKKKSVYLGILGIVLGICLILGVTKWQTSYKRTEIVRSFSDDSRYCLVIDQIGEPDWPYGTTHCRAVLRREKQKIAEQTISLQNDGAMAQPENFRIVWQKSGVSVLVRASEQEDREICILFPVADE